MRSLDNCDVEIGSDAEAGAVEAETADELHRHAPVERQPDIIDHLALVVLVDSHHPGTGGRTAKAFGREGEQGEATHPTHRRPLGSELPDRGLHVQHGRPEGDDDDLVAIPAVDFGLRLNAGRHLGGGRGTRRVVVREVIADVAALLGRTRERDSLARPLPPLDPDSAHSGAARTCGGGMATVRAV